MLPGNLLNKNNNLSSSSECSKVRNEVAPSYHRANGNFVDKARTIANVGKLSPCLIGPLELEF